MSVSLLFNPSRASTAELESTFVGRHKLLERLERDLLGDQTAGTPRHWQIVGPRGSGKSHLTELLVRRLEKRHAWRVARLPEENYQASSLGELLEQVCLRADPRHQTVLGPDLTEEQLQDRALDLLRQSAEASSKPLLVVLENLSSVLERQVRTSRDQGRLRDFLTNRPPFVLVATSTSQSDATTRHEAPLYDFFHTVSLEDLRQEDITELVRARASWEGNSALLADFERVRGRLEAVYHLSGGNPRLALALYAVLQHGVTSELHEQVMKLLDEVTPYYQARLADISPQAVRVLTEMAVAEHLLTPAALARRCRLPTNQVTAVLRKLQDERLVVQGHRPNARSRLYGVRDRLLRIWIQMRESAGAARRLHFLVEFFERWYEGRKEELEEASRRTVSDFWTNLTEGDMRRCGDRLMTIGYLAEIHPGFDGSAVLRAMRDHVHDSSEADLRAHVIALKQAFESTEDSRERQAAAYLLAECFRALGEEGEGVPFLKSAMEGEAESAILATRYASALVARKDFNEAWEFGTKWIVWHPDHQGVKGQVGIAGAALARHDVALSLLEEYLGSDFCAHCTQVALRRVFDVIGEKDETTRLRYWTHLIGRSVGGSASVPRLMHATLAVLYAERLSRVPPSTFREAMGAWQSLSEAPRWFLGRAVCGLSHRTDSADLALASITAISEKTGGPLPAFAVDHLVEVIPALQYAAKNGVVARVLVDQGMQLLRSQTAPDLLSSALRSAGPVIARTRPELTFDLLKMYVELRAGGQLPENITPYAELIALLRSDDARNEIYALHPETREAVILLLSAITKNPADREMSSMSLLDEQAAVEIGVDVIGKIRALHK